VGECLSIVPLARRLRLARPDTPVVLTYTSPSAHHWPRGWPLARADYLPPDQPRPVRSMLDALQPRILIFSRSDLWPELASRALGRAIPLALVGGSVRPGSGRLRWPLRSWLRPIYAGLAYAAAASPGDAQRLAALGVRPDVLETPGDPRHDAVLERVPDLGALGGLLEWAAGREVLVAGSTEPEDEEVLLEAFAQLRRQHGSAGLLLCPHRPTPREIEALEQAARRRGLQSRVWRGGRLPADAPALVLASQSGVLADLYALGQVAYVGGGFGTKGLHAVIEPAAYAVPVIIGPRGHRADAASLLAAGAAVVLPARQPVPALVQAWVRWLADPEARLRAGLAGRRIFQQGAAGYLARRLLALLG